MRRPIQGFAPETVAALRAHPFPGNVRELRNLVERAVILCQTGRVTLDDLKFDPAPKDAPPAGEAFWAASAGATESAPVRGTDLRGFIRDAPAADLDLSLVEKEVVQEALRRCGGSQVQAAQVLGISRDALRRRMIHYELK